MRMPVANWKGRQGRDGRRRIDAYVEIGLVVIPVAWREPDAHGAGVLWIEIDEGVEIKMVGPAAHRRSAQTVGHEVLSDVLQRPAGIVVPSGEPAKCRLKVIEQVASTGRDQRIRHVVGKWLVEREGVEALCTQARAEPCADVSVASIVQGELAGVRS